MKILMDSSGWIEFFTGGPFAERYAAYLTPRHDIITPTVVLYEVYKKIKREKGEETALLFTGRLRPTHVVQLTESIAIWPLTSAYDTVWQWPMQLYMRRPKIRKLMWSPAMPI